MMVDLYRTFGDPVSDRMLFAWHEMLFEKRGGLKDIGQYRTGRQADGSGFRSHPCPRVHFEAPPAMKVPEEMTRFCGLVQPHRTNRH